MVKGRIVLTGYVLIALLIVSCLQSDDPLAWPLHQGDQVGDLLTPGQRTVVLVVNPGEYFTCYSVLAEWFEWRDQHPNEFLFLYSRQPTNLEARSLRRLRLQPDGILSFDIGPDVGIEMLVAGDSIHAMNQIRSGQNSSQLLDLIGSQPLSEAR